MRLGASFLILVIGLGLSGCAAKAVLNANNNSANNQPNNGIAMYDPPLSVPPGFNAPPLETPASNTPPPAANVDSPPALPASPTPPVTATSLAPQPGGPDLAAQPGASTDLSGTPPPPAPPGTTDLTGAPAPPATTDLTGTPAPATPAAAQTPGEQAFLQAAGASDVDPNIRAQIDAASQAGTDPAFVDKLIFGPSTPASAGGGAEIKRAKPGMLDSIF